MSDAVTLGEDQLIELFSAAAFVETTLETLTEIMDVESTSITVKAEKLGMFMVAMSAGQVGIDQLWKIIDNLIQQVENPMALAHAGHVRLAEMLIDAGVMAGMPREEAERSSAQGLLDALGDTDLDGPPDRTT